MKHQPLPYRGSLVELARKNRQNMTKGELLLWQKIRRRQVMGVKFSRQIVIKNFIIDFFSKEYNLAIEVQGYSHTLPEVQKKDQIRFEALRKLDINILEVDDKYIFHNMDNAIAMIQEKIEEIRKSWE